MGYLKLVDKTGKVIFVLEDDGVEPILLDEAKKKELKERGIDIELTEDNKVSMKLGLSQDDMSYVKGK